MKKTDSRFLREIKTMTHIVTQYCSAFHCPGVTPLPTNLCDTCSQFLTYSEDRLLNCPFGADKPACSECHIHCYRQQERDLAKAIMRYAGPRIGAQQPWLALLHLWDKFRSKARIRSWKSKRSRQL